VIELTMPMSVSANVWQQNKGSVSVNYGPLTLSLKIDEISEPHDSRDKDFVQDDSHWQEGVDASLWPCYVLRPGSDWNYALKVDKDNLPMEFSVVNKDWPADDFPFTLESVPLEFHAKGVQIPSWGYDETGMTDLLPTKYAERSNTDTPLTLVPMGAARLRIAAFPREVVE
ncbi:MAG: glycoside hydrolase family 127 protein, partial [Muribaculaceae bacterium]|nr:glycoside hydrolase family 127 protein [Muribaculaceae bacterium]